MGTNQTYDQAMNPTANDLAALFLDNLTDEQLLKELLRRNIPTTAPTKIELASGHLEATIGIGKDHVADIIIDSEALDKLNE